MARYSPIEHRLSKEYADLHQVIPDLVNRYGQEGTARKLGVKQAWVSRWLRDNGYQKKSVWVRDVHPKTA